MLFSIFLIKKKKKKTSKSWNLQKRSPRSLGKFLKKNYKIIPSGSEKLEFAYAYLRVSINYSKKKLEFSHRPFKGLEIAEFPSSGSKKVGICIKYLQRVGNYKETPLGQKSHMDPLKVGNYRKTSERLENPSSEFFHQDNKRSP